VKLGFLDYHAAVKQCGERRLFPEIEPNTRGQLSGHYSRLYGRYLARIGIKADDTVNFHSFRHGFADALRRAEYLDAEFAFLLGHTQGSTTGRYGILPEGQLSQRVRMIEAVSFPDLDLTHLYVG
jgi:integrase